MSLDKSVVETLVDHEERISELEQNGGGGGGSPFKLSAAWWDFSSDHSSNVDTDPGVTEVYWGWREFSAIKWRDEDPDWGSEDPDWEGMNLYHVVFKTSFSFTPESPGATDVVFEIPLSTYEDAGAPFEVMYLRSPLAVMAMDADSVILPASAAYYPHYDNADMLLLLVKVDAATAGREVEVFINTQFIAGPHAP